MMFSIITPSFNSMPLLPRCCFSVADQCREEIELEHWVVDGGSRDGTVEWLCEKAAQFGISWLSEKDKGMYDALNKGLQRSTGTIWAWLNSDEQYLPGTLEIVAKAFQRHPEVDMIYGDALVVDSNNKLLCVRRGEPIRYRYVLDEGLHALTCGFFFRREALLRLNGFDVDLKCSGENDLLLRLLRAKCPIIRIPVYLSAYTLTGENLGNTPQARKEFRLIQARYGRTSSKISTFYSHVFRKMEKWRLGAYKLPRNLNYSLVAASNGRHLYRADDVSARWPRRKEGAQ